MIFSSRPPAKQGRPRYAKLWGDIISEMICKEIMYNVKTEVEFCTEEQVVSEDGEDLFIYFTYHPHSPGGIHPQRM